MADAFHSLSCALTGQSDLDQRLSMELEQRIRSHFPSALQSLLDAFAAAGSPSAPEIVMGVLGNDDSHHRVAREIIRVWFTGQFETQYEGIDGPRTAQQWEAGLLWRVIQAPAPGFSKNPYGVWAAPPQNEKK